MYNGKPLTPGTEIGPIEVTPLLSIEVGEGDSNVEEDKNSDDTSTADDQESESNELDDNNENEDDEEDVEEEEVNEEENEDDDDEEPAEQLYATRSGWLVNPHHCLIKETETGLAVGTPLGTSSELGLMMAE